MSYLNETVTRGEAQLGIVGKVRLSYDHPINVPQFFSAVCEKTIQGSTMLKVQNLSSSFALTFFVNPAPSNGKQLYTIPANDPTPRYLPHNWNGAVLKVSNMSQEAATARVSLTEI